MRVARVVVTGMIAGMFVHRPRGIVRVRVVAARFVHVGVVVPIRVVRNMRIRVLHRRVIWLRGVGLTISVRVDMNWRIRVV